ncbi:MAG TPA: hypothetical protein VFI44_12240 [Ornithinibacter sp.]|nr:hypothetical protein [Ornithinibacter sp.]
MNLDQRLADAAHHVAEQVDPPEVDLDAVRSRARANRRATLALAVAAAIVAVGLVGVPLLAAGRDTTAPQPAVSPRSEIIKTLRDSDCAGDRCLRPGVYGIPLGQDRSGQRLRARMVVRSVGWEAGGWQHRVSRANDEGAVVLNVYQPHGFAGPQPCDAGAMRAVAPDASADEVVRLITVLPQFALIVGPRALPAFGRDTRYLQVRADRITCPDVEGAQYNLADIYGGDGTKPVSDSDIDPDQPVLIEFWVLELDGKPVVVEARQEGTPGQAMIQQLDEVRESLSFGIRR